MRTMELYNGVSMPMMGLGTWQLKGLRMITVVRRAVKAGYAMFDLAAAYGNEKWFRYALTFCGKKRSDVFITSKLRNAAQKSGDVQGAFNKSLQNMGLDYLDLYLIHWPVPETYIASWKVLENLYREKKVRAIGVCNCHEHHLRKLLDACDIAPMVNQIELHPLLSQKPLASFCEKNNIRVEAYTPLARMNERLILNPALVALSKKYNKTTPQIILRWNYQNGIASIPKTGNKKRLIENISIDDFQLSEDEMIQIDGINEDFRVRFDPDNCDFDKL